MWLGIQRFHLQISNPRVFWGVIGALCFISWFLSDQEAEADLRRPELGGRHQEEETGQMQSGVRVGHNAWLLAKVFMRMQAIKNKSWVLEPPNPGIFTGFHQVTNFVYGSNGSKLLLVYAKTLEIHITPMTWRCWGYKASAWTTILFQVPLTFEFN